MVNGEALIRFRSNIEENPSEDGDPDFICDEYTLRIPNSPHLEEKIRANLEAYAGLAAEADRLTVAAEVRAQRNRLLQESDAAVAIDRINLSIPEGITTASLLGSVKMVFSALRDATTGPWAQYRQALRDIPQQPGFPYDVEFPTKPE